MAAGLMFAFGMLLGVLLGVLVGVWLGVLLGRHTPRHVATTTQTEHDDVESDSDVSADAMPPPAQPQPKARPRQPEVPEDRLPVDRPMPMPATQNEGPCRRGKVKFHGDRKYRILEPPLHTCTHQELRISTTNQWGFTGRCPSCHLRMTLWWLPETDEEHSSWEVLARACREIP